VVQGASEVAVRGPGGIEFCLPLLQSLSRFNVALFQLER